MWWLCIQAVYKAHNYDRKRCSWRQIRLTFDCSSFIYFMSTVILSLSSFTCFCPRDVFLTSYLTLSRVNGPSNLISKNLPFALQMRTYTHLVSFSLTDSELPLQNKLLDKVCFGRWPNTEEKSCLHTDNLLQCIL